MSDSWVERPDEKERREQRERRRAQRRRRKERKALRKLLVGAERNVRPEVLWRLALAWRRYVAERRAWAEERSADDRSKFEAREEERAKGGVETLLGGGIWITWTLLGLFLTADIARVHYTKPSLLYGHKVWAYVVLFSGLAALLLIFIDISTYRPRLFFNCSASPKRFFVELAPFSTSLEERVQMITQARAENWQQAKNHEQKLLDESHQFLLIDSLRFQITRHVLYRLAALVASLAVIGYSLSTLSHGKLFVGASPGAGMPEHLYFALTAFFTVLGGDIHPEHALLGYAYFLIVALVFIAVIYFVLTDIVSSQGEFRSNIRHAAQAYVLQNASF